MSGVGRIEGCENDLPEIGHATGSFISSKSFKDSRLDPLLAMVLSADENEAPGKWRKRARSIVYCNYYKSQRE